jgi:xanthine dehydrogenase YagR molybdenum-binding subunit
MDAGRIINPLAGRSQIEGAIVMGIGMALLEHTSDDRRTGAPINSNLADYVVAVRTPTCRPSSSTSSTTGHRD